MSPIGSPIRGRLVSTTLVTSGLLALAFPAFGSAATEIGYTTTSTQGTGRLYQFSTVDHRLTKSYDYFGLKQTDGTAGNTVDWSKASVGATSLSNSGITNVPYGLAVLPKAGGDATIISTTARAGSIQVFDASATKPLDADVITTLPAPSAANGVLRCPSRRPRPRSTASVART